MRIVIRRVSITAASPIEARRLADGLPAALERALTRLEGGAKAEVHPRPRSVDRVAAEVAAAVRVRLDRSRNAQAGDVS